MARLDTRQLGFDFTRAIAAAATAPVDAPFTAEEQVAIDCLPHGDGWQAFVAVGAVPEVIDVAIAKRAWEHSRVYITATRLGVTSGYSYNLGDQGSGGGGHLWPNRDPSGLYVWRDRDAAIRHGAHELWASLAERDAKHAVAVLRGIRQGLGFDATLPPPETAKRRLISRPEHLRRMRSMRPDERAELAAYEARVEALQ